MVKLLCVLRYVLWRRFCAGRTDTVSAWQEAKALLLVANQGDHTLSLIDPDAGQEIAKIATHGNHAHEVAASPDGRFAYLPIYGEFGRGQAGD